MPRFICSEPESCLALPTAASVSTDKQSSHLSLAFPGLCVLQEVIASDRRVTVRVPL